MHVDEIHIDSRAVSRLIREQFPQLSHLHVTAVPSTGTDNAMFRLGHRLVVRLPRIASAVLQVNMEQWWLPLLAPHLPLQVPKPIAVGVPSAGYPWAWSVYNWLDGDTLSRSNLRNPVDDATALAQFVHDLQQLDATGGPVPGDHNSRRGAPLTERDPIVRKCIATLNGQIDSGAATAEWEAALAAPSYSRSPVWIHGDLQPGNLLAVDGRLSAVIDFGCLGIGDPACDLQVAWNLFSGSARAKFRSELVVDDATWARGRGWALSVALIALPYYEVSNPVIAQQSRDTISEVLSTQ